MEEKFQTTEFRGGSSQEVWLDVRQDHIFLKNIKIWYFPLNGYALYIAVQGKKSIMA